MTTIQINSRGNLTLPIAFRKRLGLDKGGVVIAEESGDGVVLRPAVAFPIEVYSDERISEFDADEKELSAHLAERQRGR